LTSKKATLVRSTVCGALLLSIFAAEVSAATVKSGPNTKTTGEAQTESPYSFMTSNQGGSTSFREKQYFKFDSQKINAHADSLEYVGGNIVASGNVQIKYMDIIIHADKAIINPTNKDLDAKGHILLKRSKSAITNLSLEQYDKALQDPNKRLEVIGYKMTTTGQQLLVVREFYPSDVFKADRISGNLQTGNIEFDKFFVGYKNFFCSGDSATRTPDGQIKVKNAIVTTCEYIQNDQEHYSVNSSELTIMPANNPSDLSMYNPDQGEHSYWGYNCTLNLGGIPVLWLPAIYKPSDVSPGLCQVKGGYNSDWGGFLQLSKKFKLSDYPYIEDRIHTDFYSKRGFGYGNELWMDTQNSRTNLFTYFIHDNEKWGTDDSDEEEYRANKYRLNIPSQRYDIRLSNLTHLTSRLDFRGNLEVLSDYQFLDDFFSDRADNTPQPASYAALEYQNDYFSATAYARPRVNNFYTAVQRLPEFNLDTPRQELFSNIYHQSSTSFANMNMMFRDWDEPRTTGNGVDPDNYSSIRFDTVHMLYYPLQFFEWLNITPRIGGRLTYYNTSSKTKIDDDDLTAMFIADDVDITNDNMNVVNYDSKGGARLRAVGEIGIQANTKIYRSWQNVKNVYWQLDGLRHVAEPYMNYTFIPQPTVSNQNLYYFDDIDRIDRQNFVRFGLKNRLQTRRGEFGSEEIFEWASLENYIDYHLDNQGDLSQLSDLATILKFNPTSKLSLTSVLLLDLSNNKTDVIDTYRNGRYTDRAGISCKWIDKWQTTIRYTLFENASVFLAYDYQDYYRSHSAYSMGSTMSAIESGTAFGRYYDRNQTIRAGIEVPVPFIPKTKAAYEIYYDVEAGFMRQQQIRLTKVFHCWQISLVGVHEIDRDSDGSKDGSFSVYGTLTLTAMPGMGLGSSQKFETDSNGS